MGFRQNRMGDTEFYPAQPPFRVCDCCDGSGIEDITDPTSGECHLCEGSGYFDADGFPTDDIANP